MKIRNKFVFQFLSKWERKGPYRLTELPDHHGFVVQYLYDLGLGQGEQRGRIAYYTDGYFPSEKEECLMIAGVLNFLEATNFREVISAFKWVEERDKARGDA